jgi:hypothetical protein
MCVLSVGHLDRVLHGISAEEVLYACDENPAASSSGDVGLANPAVHFFRGLRHRNLSAIRHATQVQELPNNLIFVCCCIFKMMQFFHSIICKVR